MNKYLLNYLRKLNQKPITDESRHKFDNYMFVLAVVAIIVIVWGLYLTKGAR